MRRRAAKMRWENLDPWNKAGHVVFMIHAAGRHDLRIVYNSSPSRLRGEEAAYFPFLLQVLSKEKPLIFCSRVVYEGTPDSVRDWLLVRGYEDNPGCIIMDYGTSGRAAREIDFSEGEQ